MKGKRIAKRRAKQRERELFLGGKGIIVGGHEAAIRPWNSAQAAKSSTAQAQFLRPIWGKYSRARHRPQTAAKLTIFMTGIRTFMKGHAILWQKLHARFSDHTFYHATRVPGSRVATLLDIRDRVSVETGRLSQVPNRPIQRRGRHQNLCIGHHETVPASHAAK